VTDAERPDGAARARKPGRLRRREIADAALKVIAEQGLGRFTARAIAREVGLTDAALFRHFRTKEEIVLAVIDRVEEILFGSFPPSGADPIDRLGAFFRRRVAIIEQNPGVARLVVSDALSQAAPPRGVARVVEFRRRSMGFARACLAEAARDGLLAPGIAPEEAAVPVLGSLMALTHGRGPDVRGGTRLAGRVWDLLERLLRGSGRAGPPAARVPAIPAGLGAGGRARRTRR
jgi:AcrR family transcriptional regulator